MGINRSAIGPEYSHSWPLPGRCIDVPGPLAFTDWIAEPNRADGAASLEFLRLLVPVRVERALVIWKARRSVGQHDRNLAAQVDARKIIMLQFRGVHRLCYKHHGRGSHLAGRGVVRL